jgi:hypothetical protein
VNKILVGNKVDMDAKRVRYAAFFTITCCWCLLLPLGGTPTRLVFLFFFFPVP